MCRLQGKQRAVLVAKTHLQRPSGAARLCGLVVQCDQQLLNRHLRSRWGVEQMGGEADGRPGASRIIHSGSMKSLPDC